MTECHPERLSASHVSIQQQLADPDSPVTGWARAGLGSPRARVPFLDFSLFFLSSPALEYSLQSLS